MSSALASSSSNCLCSDFQVEPIVTADFPSSSCSRPTSPLLEASTDISFINHVPPSPQTLSLNRIQCFSDGSKPIEKIDLLALISDGSVDPVTIASAPKAVKAAATATTSITFSDAGIATSSIYCQSSVANTIDASHRSSKLPPELLVCEKSSSTSLLAPNWLPLQLPFEKSLYEDIYRASLVSAQAFACPSQSALSQDQAGKTPTLHSSSLPSLPHNSQVPLPQILPSNFGQEVAHVAILK
ncbi:unnamed protein product [Protopolystoma xenopodis]|uniref:Uncharacterized protein n=1 Tax=Protopolystoma xenopodis TaxID=117903 RepID=A0A448X190_9PLAT|nr:unnamed protein product [Protopolystoma xenopodis]